MICQYCSDMQPSPKYDGRFKYGIEISGYTQGDMCMCLMSVDDEKWALKLTGKDKVFGGLVEFSASWPINFCPVCGRDLRGGDDEGA